MKKYIVQTCLQSKAKLKVHYETIAVIFSSHSLVFFFSDSKTIYTDILYSIYILINTMPDNPVLYIYSQTSPVKYCYPPHSVPDKKEKD